MTAPLVFLDTETTGLHPGREAWEIAMIRREPDGSELTRAFFVQLRDLDMATADPFALSIGKFYDRHPAYTQVETIDFFDDDDSPELGEIPVMLPACRAAALVANFTRGAHIVGAVPNFDTETLDRLLRRHNNLPGWHYHLVDVENLAVGYIARASESTTETDIFESGHGDPPSPPWSSRELGDMLNVFQDETTLHTALGDARWALRMYDRVMT